jgi:hypothetical protein
MTNSCSKQRNAPKEWNHDVTYRTSSELIEEERYSGGVTRDGGPLQEIEIAMQE